MYIYIGYCLRFDFPRLEQATGTECRSPHRLPKFCTCWLLCTVAINRRTAERTSEQSCTDKYVQACRYAGRQASINISMCVYIYMYFLDMYVRVYLYIYM